MHTYTRRTSYTVEAKSTEGPWASGPRGGGNYLSHSPLDANAGEEFPEAVPSPGPITPGIFHREPFDEVLAQPFGRPIAGLRTGMRPDAVFDGQDRVQMVVIDYASDFAIALGLELSGISG